MDFNSNINLVITIIAFYFTGLISILGIIGNILAVAVLVKSSRHKRQALFTILSGLCIVDAVFILSNFFINVLGVFYEFHQFKNIIIYFFFLIHGYTIKLLMPLTFTTQLASIYLTVLVSYERFTAVCKPLSVVTTHSSSRQTLRNISLIIIFSLMYNIPKYFEINIITKSIGEDIEPESKQIQLIETSLEHFGCYHSYDFRKNVENGYNLNVSTRFSNYTCDIFKYTVIPNNWYSIANSTVNVYELVYHGITYSITYFIIPVTIITVLNIRIVFTLRKNIAVWRNPSRKQIKEVQLTYVSLAIVISFYFFLLPNVIWTIVSVLKPKTEHDHHEAEALATVINNFLVLVNSCQNLIVYCAFGKKFRETLKEMFCCHNRIERQREMTVRALRHSSGNSHSNQHQNQNAKRNGRDFSSNLTKSTRSTQLDSTGETQQLMSTANHKNNHNKNCNT